VPRLLEAVGLRRPEGVAGSLPAAVLRGLAAGLAAAALAACYLEAVERVPFLAPLRDSAIEMSLTFQEGGAPWLLCLALGAAPVFEEYIFRGLLYPGLRRTYGVGAAILGSAALFAIVHPPAAMLPVFGLGLAAAWSFEKTGVLLAPIIAHAAYNAAVLAVQVTAR
jgi:membrane protease YdiL (CAAX protease family)